MRSIDSFSHHSQYHRPTEYLLTGTLNIVSPLNYPEWDAWIATVPGATIFHSSHWARVLAESYGYKPVYFTTGLSANPPVLLPMMEVSSFLTGNRGVSLPFSDNCKVLSPPTTSRNDVLEPVLDYGRRAAWRFVEFRDDALFGEGDQYACCFYHHYVDLERDLEAHARTLKHGTRASLHKAIKEGARIRFSYSPESVDTYYQLNCLTRKRHGLPPQPLHFFRKIFEHLIAKKSGVVVEVVYHNRVIAAAVCLEFSRNVIMKYAAYDYAYQSVRPNNLLVWETIRWYADHGFKILSFGRSDLKNEGLRRFKNAWNLVEEVVRYYKFDLKRNQLIADSHPWIDWSPRVMKNVPIPVLRMFGNVLYKHMG